jgi:hypothetical protein
VGSQEQTGTTKFQCPKFKVGFVLKFTVERQFYELDSNHKVGRKLFQEYINFFAKDNFLVTVQFSDVFSFMYFSLE